MTELQPFVTRERTLAEEYDRNDEGDNDHNSQPGILFEKVMTDQDRANTIGNIVGAMIGISRPKRLDIIKRRIENPRPLLRYRHNIKPSAAHYSPRRQISRYQPQPFFGLRKHQ
ncbi:MAG: hypothetical protein IPJ82_09855 [Lewinellaceae bacterium]|nr:hypothetical protein [Lewinellaceae bacterium]